MTYTSTILIVDDDPGARATLEALLASEGYDLTLAASGAEALEKAASLKPDIILLDVMMPGMDGFEVCQRLRSDPLLAQVPVILVTALDDQASRLRGIETGADDFVSKPFNRAELRARVRNIARLNRYRQLLAERTKFQWAVDQSNDGYLILDARGAILYANTTARLYLELPMDDSLPAQQTFVELAYSHYQCEPEEAWASWAKLPVAPQPRYLVRPESPTATASWLQVHALELPGGEGRVVLLRDVTAEMTLQRSTWEFQAMVSHKLRTPLTSVLTCLELVKQELTPTPNTEVAELIGMALHGAERLRNQINEIFQYMEASRLALPQTGPQVSQLRSIIAGLASELGLQAVTVTIEDELGDQHLRLSQPAIELALGEILENSLKFHPRQSPTIEITISRSDASAVCMQISDDGQTLSAEQLARVWTPYYQGEKYFTGSVAGMGLGLPMVASLVWGVGGKCHISNRTGRAGVVVKLVLPVE